MGSPRERLWEGGEGNVRGEGGDTSSRYVLLQGGGTPRLKYLVMIF